MNVAKAVKAVGNVIGAGELAGKRIVVAGVVVVEAGGGVGALASIASPLADAGVSVFAVAAYDTNYILVKNAHLERAVAALTAAGHTIIE